MHSIKQSNWILGLGVVVAIILIVATLWLKFNPGEANDTVINKPVQEIGQTLKKAYIRPIGLVTIILKTLN